VPTDLERIQAATAALESKKQARSRYEARYEQFLEQFQEFKARLTAEGVDPKKIDEMVASKQAELDSKLKDLEAALDGTDS